MTPTHASSRQERFNRPALARRLLRVTRRVLAPLGLSILARTLFLLLGIGIFGLAGWAVVAIPTGTAPLKGLAPIAGAMIALSLLKGLARYLEQFAGHFVAFHSLAILRNHFYDRLEPQAPAFTEGRDSGDLLNRVTKDIDRIEVFFAHTLAPATTAILVPAIALAWMGVATSWWLALVLLPFLILAGLVVPSLGVGRTDAAARELRAERGRLAAHVADSVQGVREVLAFGIEDPRLREMERIEERIGEQTGIIGRRIAARRGLNQTVLALSMIVLAMTGIGLHSQGRLELDSLGLALGIALGSFASVIAVEDFMADLDQAFASAERVFSITERTPLVVDAPDHREAGADTGIEVDSVSFTYPFLDEGNEGARRPEVLHAVSLSITPGSFTAIVGASGSGKSTIAGLLTRTWDPDSGAVRIGGVDARRIGLASLRSVIASATQRPYLFNDTVRANLLLAEPEASEEELHEALRMAGLSDWIAQEPEGIDTVVGNMGERLSGGQRQRLALARTLLRHAPITLLDEATSQLDASTERLVLEGIREATRGRTLIVIAHRISTVVGADQIIVMDSGRVVESGTYEELIAEDGALAALVARQDGPEDAREGLTSRRGERLR